MLSVGLSDWASIPFDPPGGLGGDEHRARVREPGLRQRADEPFVAQDLAGAQAEDRLVDRGQQPLCGDARDGGRELVQRARVLRDPMAG